MARRRRQEERENHDRWMVSYADFMTLLFAFFVVMYAISNVNEGKYKTLSDALLSAFNAQPRTLEPIQIGQLARTRDSSDLPIQGIPRTVILPEVGVGHDSPGHGEGGLSSLDPATALAAISEQLVDELEPLISQELVKVRRSELWLEVEINTSILFPSASVVLSDEAEALLRRLANILKPYPNPIRVEGFADALPINTTQFASNWELSAARAARVVRLLGEEGVDPTRMAAVGFGEYRPVADNRTTDGRRQNRRVALVVLAGHDSRYLMDVERASSEIRLPGGLTAPGVGR